MLLIVFFLTLVLAYGAYKLKSLTLDGFAAAVCLGFGLYLLAGPIGYGLMGVFFVSSSILSKVAGFFTADLRLDLIHERQDRRDATQVFSNGVVPLILGLFYTISHEPGFLVGVAACFSAAAADTWASEIGVLSPHPPRLLIRRSTVTPGLSGGVSILGSFAALGGSICIAISYGVFSWLLSGFTMPSSSLVPEMVGIALGGLLGAFTDSLLGELFQAKYQSTDPNCPITEKPFNEGRQANHLIEGYRFINNNRVNLFSCLLAGLVVALAFLNF